MVEFLLGSARGEDVATLIRNHGAESRLHAPDLLDIETAQVFRRLVARGSVHEARADGAMELLPLLPVSRHPCRVLLPRIWALRGVLTAYDAAYVSLAEALDATVVTCDRRLARAHGHTAHVVAL